VNSPFPGMDPYLEISGDWRDFHAMFIASCRDAISERLPENYIARLDERFCVQEEIRETWIEIRKQPNWTLVTSIEVLSPTNKVEPGFSEFCSKRVSLIIQPVHLVAIDLVVAGFRLPMANSLPPGDYYAIVSRSDSRPESQVYAWSVRHSLPIVPIPLAHPDPDIPLNLAEVLATTYQRGRYDRSIDYRSALTIPLSPEDRAWAEEVARDAVR
jgi:hypothetical protein